MRAKWATTTGVAPAQYVGCGVTRRVAAASCAAARGATLGPGDTVLVSTAPRGAQRQVKWLGKATSGSCSMDAPASTSRDGFQKLQMLPPDRCSRAVDARRFGAWRRDANGGRPASARIGASRRGLGSGTGPRVGGIQHVAFSSTAIRVGHRDVSSCSESSPPCFGVAVPPGRRRRSSCRWPTRGRRRKRSKTPSSASSSAR